MVDQIEKLSGYMYSLRPPTLTIWSQMLNPPKILLSDDGHLRY